MKRLILATAAVALMSGCASIIEGGTQPIVLKSEPNGANITVTNRAGQQIHTGTAPMTVSLSRGAGYFKSEQYTVRFQKDGFAPKELVITGSVNGWYFGNILLGGLIGMLAVDPVTGAMYTLHPADATGTLEAAPADKPAARSEAVLTVVSTQDLSAEQLSRARLLPAN